MLEQHLLGEHDVELNDQVSAWAIALTSKLGLRVDDDITGQGTGHAFACDSQLSLGCNHVFRSHEHLPIIEGVDGDRLHLQGVEQSQRVSVDKVVALTHEVGQRLLCKLDYQV